MGVIPVSLLDQFPSLDDVTFEELVKEARLLIPQFAREAWTDHNAHDPGITFMELFAWLAEMQIYQLNRVTEKNYKKFLKLVGLSPYSAQPARVDITFNEVEEEKTIEKGTKIFTELASKKIVFETEEDINLVQANLKSIITRSNSQVFDNTNANKKDDIYFAAFGEKGSIGSTLELEFDKTLPKKEIQISFDLFDKDLPSPGIGRSEPTFSVSVLWEYLSGEQWKKFTIKKDTTLALNRSGRIVFDLSSDMDEQDGPDRIRCRLKDGQYEIIPLVSKILLNTVPAVQIENIKENLGTGYGIPEQKVELKKKPVIRGSQKILVGGYEWEEKDDLESSGPEDKHYLFDPDKGEITFGNGLNGSIPAESQEIGVSYKTTLGQGGNILAGQKWVIKAGSENISGINYKQAAGGMDAESIEHAKSRAKKDFRTLYRAITSEDYEQLALSTPGLRVARAKAIPDYNPEYPCIDSPGSITVVIVPYTRGEEIIPVPGKGFIQTVSSFLDTRRLITTYLHVISPEYVKISVMCKVSITKKSSSTEVVKRIKDALKKFLDPLTGGTDGKGWPFGRAVYPSEIYQIINNVEGFDYATDVSLSAESANRRYTKVRDIIQISPVALVVSGEHQVEII